MIPVGWFPLKHYSLLELQVEVLGLEMMHNAVKLNKNKRVFQVTFFQKQNYIIYIVYLSFHSSYTFQAL